MAIQYTKCNKRYFTNAQSLGVQFNVVQLNYVVMDGYMEIYFPRPWLLTGFAKMDPVPSAAPNYLASNPTLYSASIQDTHKDLLITLFIDLCLANMYEDDSGLFSQLQNQVRYVGPGPQGVDYRGYFSKFLNDKSGFGEYAQSVYNVFVQPESLVWHFWETFSAAASADEYYMQYIDLSQKLFKTTDLRMWGAPGIYRINMGPNNFSWAPQAYNENHQYD